QAEDGIRDRNVTGVQTCALPILSFVFAFLIGSVLIVIADQEVRATLGYFFDRPSDALTAIWQSVTQAYGAMFRGAVFDGPGFSRDRKSVVQGKRGKHGGRERRDT